MQNLEKQQETTVDLALPDDMPVEVLNIDDEEDRAIAELEDFRQRLFLQAFGEEVEDVEIIENGDGEVERVIRRRHRTGGDQKALEKYLQIFGRT